MIGRLLFYRDNEKLHLEKAMFVQPTDVYKLLHCALRRCNAARDSDVLSTLLCSKFRLQITNRIKKSMHSANQVVQISDILIMQDCKVDHCK